MDIIILLVVLGVLLIALEVVLPGMILGIGGAICLVAASVTAYSLYGFFGAIGVATVSGFLTFIAVIVEFRLMEKTGLGHKFFLRTTSGGKAAGSVQDDAADGMTPADASEPIEVGTRCEAITRMMPTGTVRIGGKNWEAHSREGMIDRGELLEVVAIEPHQLIVQRPRS